MEGRAHQLTWHDVTDSRVRGKRGKVQVKGSKVQVQKVRCDVATRGAYLFMSN